MVTPASPRPWQIKLKRENFLWFWDSALMVQKLKLHIFRWRNPHHIPEGPIRGDMLTWAAITVWTIYRESSTENLPQIWSAYKKYIPSPPDVICLYSCHKSITVNINGHPLQKTKKKLKENLCQCHICRNNISTE